MTTNDPNRAAFLKAAGISLLGIPALGGMAAPILSPLNRHALPAGQTRPIPEKIARIADLSTLSALIAGSSIYSTLESGGPFTFFAPSNEAFAKLPPAEQHDLSDPAIALAVLEYHAINGAYLFKDLPDGSYPTLLGPKLRVKRAGPGMFINKALVERPNIVATNGYIFIINKVLRTGFQQSG